MPGLPCEIEDCEWTSLDGTIAEKLDHLKIHVQLKHSVANPVNPGLDNAPGSPSVRRKTKKVLPGQQKILGLIQKFLSISRRDGQFTEEPMTSLRAQIYLLN